MQVENTNYKLTNGAYLISYCPSGDSYGLRIMVLTYDYKKTIKKYRELGYYLFGCPTLFQDNLFFALTKSFKVKTQNKREIVIGNQMYFIDKSVKSGSFVID